MKILAAHSDDEQWTELLGQLEGLSHEIVQTSCGDDVYRQILNDPSFDLILGEVGAAATCGMDLIDKCRSNPKLRWIPFMVAGTAFSGQLVERLVSLGVRDIITVPSESGTLEAKLASVLQSGRRRILVVDDQNAIREILCEFLEMEHYRVETCASGEEALEALGSQKFHAVVSDIMMPGISGIDLMLHIREQYAGLPVILITGNTSRFSPRSALEAGADGYFAKPFHNVELAYMLRRVLQTPARTLESMNT